MNFLKGPVDPQRMGKVNCSWNLSPDPEDWSPEHDCEHQATHHIMWGDHTMTQVCYEHLIRTIQQLQHSEGTFIIHKFREQCSTDGSVWLMPANICTSPDNALV